MSLSHVLFSYFHKIPEEAPDLELKATHGLASPQEFTLPAPHAMWTGDTYAGFDVSKAHPPQQVSFFLARVDSQVAVLFKQEVKYSARRPS